MTTALLDIERRSQN